MKKFLSIIAIACALSSCDDLFTPAIENQLDAEYMYNNPTYAENLLGNAYTRLPNGSYPFTEVATDDAVSNQATNSYRQMASGTWTSQSNPVERWSSCRMAIQYINLFLSEADNVHWADDEIAANLYNARLKGEAYGLRALYMYYLLQAHGGYDESGNLLGVPIVTEPEDASTNFNYPRATFAECMEALHSDAKLALDLLPTEYGDAASMSTLAAKYPEATSAQITRVFGEKFKGRISGRIVEAVLAQANLLAASPAFSDHSGVTYADAAQSAATVLNRINGVQGMDPTGWTWYCNIDDIEAMEGTSAPAEILWYSGRSQSNSLESDNYPPTLYGNGRVNPTQNLVDAFPMLNGYPITDSRSGYNSQAPYENRDPRLAAYILYNGTQAGVANTTITTAADGTDNNALNKLDGSSTRTGYYLRKLLRQDVNLDPNSTTTKYHYSPRIRYTEIFLDYAEAANEAYGPLATGSNSSYSAYDVIKAIRQRAGIVNDDYLESIKASKEQMRDLIRNERRIELSFEGFRFWDIRRWKLDLATLNETAKGVSISNGIYSIIDVDTRNYKDYMYYCPIPKTELLKFSELLQNKGW